MRDGERVGQAHRWAEALLTAPATRHLGPRRELLERDAELSTLAGRLCELRDYRRGGVVLVEGPPGIGKTELLDVALGSATDGLTVLRASGSELEGVLAFGGVRQLFAPLVMGLDDGAREVLFEGPRRLAASVLSLPPAPGAPATLGDPLYGLFWLAVELSDQVPLVIAVDDLHWLDEQSARFVVYLAERIDGVPILVLATARPDEPGAAANEIVASLRPKADIIRPRELSEAAVERLLRRPGPEAHRATGGNPLFVVELARALAAAPDTPLDEIGPESLAELVLTRVGRVSVEARAVAQAVALFADDATVEDVAALTNLSADVVAATADALVSAQVFADDDRLRFLHPVLRRSVYDDLGTFSRRRGHARAAAVLKDRGAPADAVAAQLLHASPAGDLDDMSTLVAAADDAQARGALAAAARYLERAVDENVSVTSERAALLGRLGLLLGALGRPEAEMTLREAVEATTDPRARVALAVELAKVAFAHGRAGAVIADLERLRGTPDIDPQGSLALDALLAICLGLSDLPAAREVMGRIPRDLSGATEAERLALAEHAYHAYMSGEPATVVCDLVHRSVPGPAAQQLDVGGDLDDSVDLLVFCGDLAGAETLAQERAARARGTGAVAAYANTQVVLCDAAMARGDLVEAEAAARLGRAMLAVPARSAAFLGERLHSLLLVLGRFDEAEALRTELIANASMFGANTTFADGLTGRAAAATGDYARGAAILGRVRADYLELGIVNPAAMLWAEPYVECLGATARVDESLEMIKAFHAGAERFGETRAIALGHVMLGRVTPGPTGREHLEEAHALLDPSPYRRHAAQARLELGVRLRHDNQRAAAAQLMLPALEYAEHQQAGPLAARLREELRLTGGRPRNALRTGADSLSPAEARIARLAADGMSNKEIAQHLFLTVGTVQTTLVRVYRKLDVNSRKLLAPALSGPQTARP